MIPFSRLISYIAIVYIYHILSYILTKGLLVTFQHINGNHLETLLALAIALRALLFYSTYHVADEYVLRYLHNPNDNCEPRSKRDPQALCHGVVAVLFQLLFFEPLLLCNLITGRVQQCAFARAAVLEVPVGFTIIVCTEYIKMAIKRGSMTPRASTSIQLPRDVSLHLLGLILGLAWVAAGKTLWGFPTQLFFRKFSIPRSAIFAALVQIEVQFSISALYSAEHMLNKLTASFKQQDAKSRSRNKSKVLRSERRSRESYS
ncbi:hypothetical protein NA57DRAFT_81907 [Rhizodiscina lignyota]|uniref:Uncharacterized protein n=1 Tax=Rhizodiscina lignyota TaxID=1504668 RepID=A0A9P4M0R3_9PEZI|nr:hypothetical protein NA57DRAFT_81907 [Rhizodiscina lignyota]